ncbi:DUF2786 domain-containing protein, partial [Marinomonas sp.]
MSIRRRKKAIQKVVKLLNLATSNNSSESTMALRHAESLIRLYNIAQRELPILQLCDRSMLYKVSWGGAPPKFTKEEKVNASPQESISQRRFSERSNDPDRAYESVPTILDDMILDDVVLNDDVLDEGCSLSESFESTLQESDLEPELASILGGEVKESACGKGAFEKSDLDSVEAGVMAAHDNVIDASDVFRFESQSFAEKLGGQRSMDDPEAPFSENIYWQKIHDELADYDEVKAQTEIESLASQLSLAEENLQLRREKRHELESAEIQERAKRAEIERSFEEAMERAFRARAQSYE